MSVLKSIMSFRSCITIVFIITMIVSMKGDNESELKQQIIQDLPTRADLNFYITVLEKIIDFCVRHKLYVDMNFEFGLFLIEAGLSRDFLAKRKKTPEQYRKRLERVLEKNDEVTEYFHNMVRTTKHIKKYDLDRKLAAIFYNTSTWPRSFNKFNVELLKKTKIYTEDQLITMYGKWDEYRKFISDFDNHKPSLYESDRCIEFLGRFPVNVNRRTIVSCLVLPSCKQIVIDGTEFGYALSHRILFLVVAYFSRGCTLLTQKEDKEHVDKLCLRSFNEGRYIASNNFLLPDLMLEQICLCGLFGHAQFFTNNWLKSLFQYQTEEGCLSTNILQDKFDEALMKEEKDDKWHLVNSYPIMNGQCDSHMTAVATGAVSNAIRYIIETYY